MLNNSFSCLQDNGWKAVPQFGAWDCKTPEPMNYSMVFSQARANRKKHKSDVRHASLGNEKELLNATQQDDPVPVTVIPQLLLFLFLFFFPFLLLGCIVWFSYR